MTDWTTKHVVIVYGGRSSEREVSLRTGAAFDAALRSIGVTPTLIDLTPDRVRDLVDARPDVVLIAMHGQDGEDGSLQGLLEMLAVPYTGSGVAASALAMDKVRSKCVFERFGVPTPEWCVAVDDALEALPLAPPFVVKPALEGSSVGVSIVHDGSGWPDAWRTASVCRGAVLVERFVPGRELTVGLFDGEPMGIIEIQAAERFYDYQAKYQRGDTRYTVPTLPEPVTSRVLEAASAAYASLGCRGVARVDVLLDAASAPWVLEVNTVPGMTETSLVPKLAAARGIPFADFVVRMMEAATTDAEGVR